MRNIKIILMILLIYFSFISLAVADNSVADTTTASPILTRGKDTNDLLIKTKLQIVYNLNPELRNFNITTNVSNGVVTLKGTLQNDIQKDLAITIAKDLEDVQSVIDNITVDKNTKAGENPSDFGQKVTDATITAMTKSRLLVNPKLRGSNIQVTTVNNITTLSGTVKNINQKSLAGRLAIETAGVSTVKNNLEIQ